MAEINIDGKSIRITDKFICCCTIQKAFPNLAGYTTHWLNFKQELADLGYNYKDIVGQTVTAIDCHTTWGTTLGVTRDVAKGIFAGYTNGSTQQQYVVTALFFLAVKAENWSNRTNYSDEPVS